MVGLEWDVRRGPPQSAPHLDMGFSPLRSEWDSLYRAALAILVNLCQLKPRQNKLLLQSTHRRSTDLLLKHSLVKA